MVSDDSVVSEVATRKYHRRSVGWRRDVLEILRSWAVHQREKSEWAAGMQRPGTRATPAGGGCGGDTAVCRCRRMLQVSTTLGSPQDHGITGMVGSHDGLAGVKESSGTRWHRCGWC